MREFSLFVNVQLLAEPMHGEVPPAAVVAVRDLTTGLRCVVRSRGAMSGSRACRYSSPGHLILRLDPKAPTFELDAFSVGIQPSGVRQRSPLGATILQMEDESVSFDLVLDQYKVAIPSGDGWVDYNPAGEVPFWTSSKVRLSRVTGEIGVASPRGEMQRFRVVSGSGHSEQQCIVASASAPSFVEKVLGAERSVEALFEALLHRPRWHWFRCALFDDVHLSAHRVWNPRTGGIYREAVSLIARDGTMVEATDIYCSAPADDGTEPVPSSVSLAFTVAEQPHGIAPGRYTASFNHAPGVDWTVPFTLPLGRVCLAREAHCTVEVTRDGDTMITTGNHETIDLSTSIAADV